MAKSLGIRLFTGYRAVNRFFESLDLTLHDACDAYFFRRQNEESPQLPEWLYGRFRFLQAEIGIPAQVTINPLPHFVEDTNGDLKRYHKAAISVPYRGSRLLLRTAPVQGFVFPYVGSVGKTFLRIIARQGSLDPTELFGKITTELDRVREALQESQPMVTEFNDRLRCAINRKIRTY